MVNLGRCEEAVEQYQIIARQHQQDRNELKSEVSAGAQDAEACAGEVRAAQSALAQHNYPEANHFFGMALSHMEQAPDILFMKAQAEFELGDYFGVVSDTGKILKMHKQNIEAYQLRGEAYYRIGEHDVAVQHFREGLKLDPEHKGCKAGHKLIKSIMKKEKRGDDAHAAGRHEDAIEYWIQAINIDPSHTAFSTPTMMKIIKSYTASGQHDKAMNEAKMLSDENESLESLFVLGDAQMGAELYQEAVNTFRTAMDFEPNDRERETQEKLRNAETALKQSKEKNYYKILAVPRTAGKKEIKSAYRKLALEWHPDKNEDKEKAQKMFQDISEAYEVLSDEELKGKYDRGEDVFDNQGGGGGGRHQGFPDDMFRQHFQQGGRRGGGGRERTHHFHFG
mmetsp:Transcript_862/g.1241  ORF Transcript_862/g.1241 Transcript_862/m.1241 type:complete len:395 (-) Transcript_862:30-1214(-)